jgi:hypothetical protein
MPDDMSVNGSREERPPRQARVAIIATVRGIRPLGSEPVLALLI